MPTATRDYSTPGNTATVVRMVKPGDHIGESFGGEWIKLDAKELEHSAVAGAVWTEAEVADYERRLEEARVARFAGDTNPESRSADRRLAEAVAEREKRKKDDHTKPAPGAAQT